MSTPTLVSFSDVVLNSAVQVLPGVTIIVLDGTIAGSLAVDTTTQPGTPLATIYSDPYGLEPIDQATDPLTSDGLGEFEFWTAAGYYTLQKYGPGVNVQSVQNISMGVAGASSGPTGPTGPAGASGSGGSAGPAGANGAIGATGYTGWTGYTGLPGSNALFQERLFLGYFTHAANVSRATLGATPYTSASGDGHIYTQAEVQWYESTLMMTRNPTSGFANGQKTIPPQQSVEAGAGNLLWLRSYVDPSTFAVYIGTSHYVQGGAETPTTAGVVAVYAACFRAS